MQELVEFYLVHDLPTGFNIIFFLQIIMICNFVDLLCGLVIFMENSVV